MKTVLLLVRWLCALLGWILFFFWWRKAATPGWVSPTAVLYSLLSIVIVVSAAVLYSAVWIVHNKRLARHGKRGFVSFYKSPRFESDALGRQLVMPPMDPDRYDPIITVRTINSHKEYVPETTGKGAKA